MDPLPIIALVVISTLFGFAWHNQPARAESSGSGDASALNQAGHVNWGMVAVWSFVFLSFAALLLAGCITWANAAVRHQPARNAEKGSLASQAVQSKLRRNL